MKWVCVNKSVICEIGLVYIIIIKKRASIQRDQLVKEVRQKCENTDSLWLQISEKE